MDGEELLRMKPREIKRLHLIYQALERKISQKQAAEVAGLSPRQMRRLMNELRRREIVALCIADEESLQTGGLRTRPSRNAGAV